MLLHHIATCSLYFCSTFGNSLAVGATIAYLHDIADIFASLIKCISSTNYNNLSVLVFSVMISFWFWTRLYVFPQIIYQILTTQDYHESVATFALINGVFLSVLQFLHAYWFCLFIKMILHKIKTGQAEDL